MPAAITPVSCPFPVQRCILERLIILWECLQPFSCCFPVQHCSLINYKPYFVWMLTPVSCSFPVQGCSLRNLILYECLQPFLRFHALSMSKGAALETLFYRNACSHCCGFMPFFLSNKCILRDLFFSEHLQPVLRFHARFPYQELHLKGLTF